MFGEIKQQLQQQNDLLMRIVAKQDKYAQSLSHICEEMKKNINEYLHLPFSCDINKCSTSLSVRNTSEKYANDFYTLFL